MRRVHRTLRRLQYPGWTDAQLAALRVSVVAIVVWLPPPVVAAAEATAAAAVSSLRDMTGHHVRRIAEALEGPDAAGRPSTCAYITHRAQVLADLSRVSLAQAVAEVYGLDRAARRGRRGGRDEDEDPLGREPVHFPSYGAYLEVRGGAGCADPGGWWVGIYYERRTAARRGPSRCGCECGRNRRCAGCERCSQEVGWDGEMGGCWALLGPAF